MHGAEMREAGRLAGEAIGGFASFVRDMHVGIASRAFRGVGPLGLPARLVHDGVANALYPALRKGLAAGPRAGAELIARRAPEDAPPAAASLHGSLVLGALNGAMGDVLEQRESPFALPMTLHGEVEQPTGRLAFFVHGLCETEEAWRLFGSGACYGDLLRADLGYTPQYVRYNTGRHISDNGRDLSDLIERTVADWPVPVEEIALLGHSMGGLVSRSACHRAVGDERAWIASLRHVFCLGTPHLGAPLEKAANVAGWALGRLPETRAFAKLLNGRSVGIKDLRFGSCSEADWCDCDPDEFLTDRCQDVPFVESATYYFIGATLSRDRGHPLGHVIGDLLVRYPSASGAGTRRRIPFELDNGFHLGGATHFHLLCHPAVYEQIRGWIERGAMRRLPAAV